ncbi:hypothetical protein MKZ38_006224 [Zalerion maritima]|uniref:VTC domain-containing protein n=1 Tax=Zalerion maritima TaxID=339359 RepID=A0AAD5RWL1_9PEZI|nr:hypothetical protein MKZ38_006224 [Zalerion maritima]
MSEKKNRWGGLLRTLSVAKRSATKVRDGREYDPQPRRASDGDAIRRRRPEGLRSPSPEDGTPAHLSPPRPGLSHTQSSRRRPRRPEPAIRHRDRDVSPEGPEGRGGGGVDGDRKGRKKEDRWHPLTEWPPSGVSSTEELNATYATALIARGAPRHKGHKRALPYRDEDEFFAFYTTSTTHPEVEDDVVYPPIFQKGPTDRADLHDSMVKLMSMKVRHFPGAGPPDHPWESIEQPSYAFCYGSRPGTITLNHWASLNSEMPPPLILGDPGISIRDVELEVIMERIQELEIRGIIDDADESALYRSLYKKFIRDPDRGRYSHKPMERQITDLVLVLSKPDWIDYTKARNMVPTRYMYDPVNIKTEEFFKFFHQLLFSLELELRISWKEHTDASKDALLKQLPPRVLWSLALARRWREYVRIDEFGKHPGDVLFRYKRRGKQVRMLKRFAQIMKWPNLSQTLERLRERDEDNALDTISSHALAFFSGLVLPGPTFPFLIMNSLIDIDPDKATDDLALLSPMHPNCGFQYRGSTTYWTSTSIVGKVLAPKCREVAGWVGPAAPSSDLARNQIARIRTRKSKATHQQLSPGDVASMAERSDPLGPPAEVFPAQEYSLPIRDVDDVDDTIRIERLILRPIPEAAGGISRTTTPAMGSVHSLGRTGTPGTNGVQRPNTTSPTPGPGPKNGSLRRPDVPRTPHAPMTPGPSGAAPGSYFPPPDSSPLQAKSSGPKTFDASILFAIDTESWPLRLAHDVSFITAFPCQDGPHPLWFDYTHVVVRADEVVGVRDWGGISGGGGGIGGSAPAISYGAGRPGSSGNWGGRLGERTYGGKKLPENTDDPEKVLVVEAFGVADNEVLARAWCAHWGLSAIVADVRTTCMACAVREAYAATLTVVILVDDSGRERDD